MREWVAFGFRRHRSVLIGGLLLWALLAVGAVVQASAVKSPILPAIVTWSEWAVAVMLLPGLATAGARGLDAVSRGGRARATMEGVIAGAGVSSVDRHVAEEAQRIKSVGRPGWVRTLSTMAWVVFGVDLLLRAVFRLGWEPFL